MVLKKSPSLASLFARSPAPPPPPPDTPASFMELDDEPKGLKKSRSLQNIKQVFRRSPSSKNLKELPAQIKNGYDLVPEDAPPMPSIPDAVKMDRFGLMSPSNSDLRGNRRAVTSPAHVGQPPASAPLPYASTFDSMASPSTRAIKPPRTQEPLKPRSEMTGNGYGKDGRFTPRQFSAPVEVRKAPMPHQHRTATWSNEKGAYDYTVSAHGPSQHGLGITHKGKALRMSPQPSIKWSSGSAVGWGEPGELLDVQEFLGEYPTIDSPKTAADTYLTASEKKKTPFLWNENLKHHATERDQQREELYVPKQRANTDQHPISRRQATLQHPAGIDGGVTKAKGQARVVGTPRKDSFDPVGGANSQKLSLFPKVVGNASRQAPNVGPSVETFVAPLQLNSNGGAYITQDYVKHFDKDKHARRNSAQTTLTNLFDRTESAWTMATQNTSEEAQAPLLGSAGNKAHEYGHGDSRAEGNRSTTRDTFSMMDSSPSKTVIDEQELGRYQHLREKNGLPRAVLGAPGHPRHEFGPGFRLLMCQEHLTTNTGILGTISHCKQCRETCCFFAEQYETSAIRTKNPTIANEIAKAKAVCKELLEEYPIGNESIATLQHCADCEGLFCDKHSCNIDGEIVCVNCYKREKMARK
ncbi:Hypothetical predicted protein [Lecanosticta acicola]|uniref:Uncharacterized protein n=1 Tax=Lecanosticta acicola TaxID=111012 RepID=A0AAI9EEF4_9PEZI|nr:Hypothetical predicted protein [Lecanosticta acicola]